MQAAFDPLVFCVDPLTHSLTHTKKSAHGRSGKRSIYDLLILGAKAAESLEYQWIDGSTRICNQQVGGSSPSTSSSVLTDFTSLTPPQAAGLVRCVVRPVPNKTFVLPGTPS